MTEKKTEQIFVEMMKSNHLISLKSFKSRLPIRCRSNSDCSYDSYCSAFCNKTTHQCQIEQFNKNSLNELCSLVSSLILPDANSTFSDEYQILKEQCQQIVTEENILQNNSSELISLEIRQNLLLQNLRNLLWKNIEYQMAKITKKSTKKPTMKSIPSKK